MRRRLAAAWERFWFSAVDPVGLHAVRLLAGLLFLVWLLSFAGHERAFFGLDGWFDASRPDRADIYLPAQQQR